MGGAKGATGVNSIITCRLSLTCTIQGALYPDFSNGFIPAYPIPKFLALLSPVGQMIELHKLKVSVPTLGSFLPPFFTCTSSIENHNKELFSSWYPQFKLMVLLCHHLCHATLKVWGWERKVGTEQNLNKIKPILHPSILPFKTECRSRKGFVGEKESHIKQIVPVQALYD